MFLSKDGLFVMICLNINILYFVMLFQLPAVTLHDSSGDMLAI